MFKSIRGNIKRELFQRVYDKERANRITESCTSKDESVK